MAKRRRLIWSPEAQADLEDIWNYYARIAGVHTAANIIQEIGYACAMLEAHVYAGRGRDEIRPGLRSIVAHPHVVFYRVRDKVAEIVRVLDQRRDIDGAFAEGIDA